MWASAHPSDLRKWGRDRGDGLCYSVTEHLFYIGYSSFQQLNAE